MILVYTHPNHFAVNQVKSLLEARGIRCQMRNEFAVGGLGEIAPIDAWPELWLEQDDDYQTAQAIIDRDARAADGDDWFCGHCGERNAASFEVCWACHRERPGQA
ncbi:MAG: putative signal transducing protein [Saccharospirillum sp.]